MVSAQCPIMQGRLERFGHLGHLSFSRSCWCRGLFVLNPVYLVVSGLHGHYGPGGHSAVGDLG